MTLMSCIPCTNVLSPVAYYLIIVCNSEGEGLLRDDIEGRMKGKRPRGWPKLGIIEELMEESYETIMRRVQDKQWRV